MTPQDGGYIPRILFADQSGALQPQLINTMGSPAHKYFYGDPLQLTTGMQAALDTLAKAPVADQADEL